MALAIATLMAGNFLAVLCLLFGTSFAAFVAASPEQRIASLFLFAFIPAAAFYACGHILSRLLVLSIELYEKLGTLCLRCFARPVNNFFACVDRFASKISVGCLKMLARASVLRERAYASFHQSCSRAARHSSIFYACRSEAQLYLSSECRLPTRAWLLMRSTTVGVFGI
jgi:hypothetical protein